MPQTDIVPDVHPFILSSLPPSAAQKQFAYGVLLTIVCVVLLVIGPLAHVRTSPAPAFVPIYVTTMIATDAITAVLLFTQFAILRSRAILAMAFGYAFTALVLVPYLLTFPGLFGVAGVINGPLSTAWFFVLWRTGFPLCVIGYAVLKDADAPSAYWRGRVGAAIALSVALAAGLVLAAVLSEMALKSGVPAVVFERFRTGTLYPYAVGGPVLVMSALAALVLWLRLTSMLDLWLTVVMCLFAMEVPLSFWPNPTRFSLSWYTFRGIGIVASSLVLIVLLYEIANIYLRLLRAINAQRRERDARLLTGDAVAATMAHEVRQPLTAIVTNASAGLRLLDRSEPDLEKAMLSFRRIVADGHRADDVLESVRATFKNTVRTRAPLDVNEVIREALEFEQEALRRYKILVETAATAPLPTINGNRVQLQQVLLNLIANAIYAMATEKEARVLRVKAEAYHHDGVLISVADTGPGIAQSDMTRIFNPLFTTKPDGMGMGLAICR